MILLTSLADPKSVQSTPMHLDPISGSGTSGPASIPASYSEAQCYQPWLRMFEEKEDSSLLYTTV